MTKINNFKLIEPDFSYNKEVLSFLEEIKNYDKDLKWQYSGMGDIEEYGCYYDWMVKIKKE